MDIGHFGAALELSALCDCFDRRILSHFSAQLRESQEKTYNHPIVLFNTTPTQSQEESQNGNRCFVHHF